MMQLSERQWTRLSDMNASRCYFAPCVYRSSAYLCSGNDTSMDILELQTRRFLSPVPINLPKETSQAAVTVTIGDELVIITWNNTTTVNLLHPEPSSQKHQKLNANPISTPVKYKNQVYWVNHTGECESASGRKFEIMKILGNSS